jgi:hypothetical protein
LTGFLSVDVSPWQKVEQRNFVENIKIIAGSEEYYSECPIDAVDHHAG